MTDITDRLRLIANMKRGDMFPPAGIDNPEDWQTDGWNVGMSALLREARDEILVLRAKNRYQRHAIAELVFTGRWLLALTGAFLGSTITLLIYLAWLR